VATALLSIRDELQANAALVTRARDRHTFLADTLGKLVAAHQLPGVEIYSNGMFNPAIVTNTAWQAARETGALGDIRALADAMGIAIMSDVRRDGMTTILRDRFGQFVPLEIDFSHREGVLLDHYQRALAGLDRDR
jgi:hypothetical protein